MNTNLISDLWSLQLGVIGICVSVITLLSSSLSTKAEELKSIRNSKEYNFMNREIALSNSIKTLREFNQRVMIGFFLFSVMFIFSTILKYLPNIAILHWLISGNAMLTITILIYGIYLLYRIYLQYQKET